MRLLALGAWLAFARADEGPRFPPPDLSAGRAALARARGVAFPETYDVAGDGEEGASRPGQPRPAVFAAEGEPPSPAAAEAEGGSQMLAFKLGGGGGKGGISRDPARMALVGALGGALIGFMLGGPFGAIAGLCLGLFAGALFANR